MGLILPRVAEMAAVLFPAPNVVAASCGGCPRCWGRGYRFESGDQGHPPKKLECSRCAWWPMHAPRGPYPSRCAERTAPDCVPCDPDPCPTCFGVGDVFERYTYAGLNATRLESRLMRHPCPDCDGPPCAVD